MSAPAGGTEDQQQQPTTTTEIKVAVRVRPANSREGDQQGSSVVVRMTEESSSSSGSSSTKKKVSVTNPDTDHEKEFPHFDFLFNSSGAAKAEGGKDDTKGAAPFATQDSVFQKIGKPAVEAAVMNGSHATVLAYGESFSGKTHTILGRISGGGGEVKGGSSKEEEQGQAQEEEEEGLLPRCCKAVFHMIAEEEEKAKKDKNQKENSSTSCTDGPATIQVLFSAVEVYNEQVHDLLTARKEWPAGGLKPRLTKGGYTCDNEVKTCTNFEDDIKSALITAEKNRTVGAHNLCLQTSPSHIIYQLHLVRTAVAGTKVLSAAAATSAADGKNEGGATGAIQVINTTTTTMLNFVVLSGSERRMSTNASPEYLKEGNAINLSLSVLGNTMKSLAEGKRAQFRESKLTMLLHHSLSHGQLYLIATISPSARRFDETMSTLRFADRVSGMTAASGGSSSGSK